MSPAFVPREPRDIQQIVEWALAEEARLRIEGRASKRTLAGSQPDAHVVSMRAFAGVLEYQPEELVLTARAGTRIAEIESLLAQRNQMLAFEPPDLGAILGGDANDGTIGGTLACNLSGPRRLSHGAARDHFLGFQATNGRAERFKSGGKVVKNVTGYDLSKLLAGSRGTLAILDEVTIKVVPAPESSATLLVGGLDDKTAVDLLCRAMGSAHDVSGAAHIPGSVARHSAIDGVRHFGSGVTALRVEGVVPSVRARLAALAGEYGGKSPALLETLESHNLWRELRDVRALWKPDTDLANRQLWRLSVPPTSGASVVARVRASIEDARALYDWSGGLVWLSVPMGAHNAALIQRSIGPSGGKMTPICASTEVREQANAPPPALAALSQRIRQSFDPKGVFA